MKVTFDRNVFAKALDRCVLGNANTTNPILACVLIETRDSGKEGSLSLSATNGRVSLNTRVPVEVLSPGSFATPAKLLLNAVQSMPQGKVQIELARSRCVVTGGNRRYSGEVLPAEDFPALKDPEGATAIKLSSPLVRAVVERLEATVPDVLESRPERRGIFVRVSPGMMDGMVVAEHWVARMTVRSDTLTGNWACLVPDVLLSPLKDATEEAEEIDLLYDPGYLYVLTPDTIVRGVRLSDTAWNFDRVLSELTITERFLCPRLALIESLRALLQTSSGVESVLGVDLEHRGGNLFVSARTKTEFNDQFPVLKDLSKEPLSIRVSPKYLREAVTSAGEDFTFSTTPNPTESYNILLTTEAGYLAMIAPMYREKGPTA